MRAWLPSPPSCSTKAPARAAPSARARTSVGGNEQSVVRLIHDDVRKHYAAHYVPNNTTIVVTGDISATEIVSRIERLFGDWQRKQEPRPRAITPAAFEGSRMYLIDRPN